MARIVTTATSPLNCFWIEPGSRRSIDGFEYAVCRRVHDAECVVNEVECAHCPWWSSPAPHSARGKISMKSAGIIFGGALLVAAFTTAPAQGWQVSPEEHAAHHPAGQAEKVPTPAPTPAPEAKGMAGMKGMDMKASNMKLDELVAKMNAAQGQAKVDAMAELLTTIVKQHQSMTGNMGEMMSKMKDGAAAK